ncbi:MAG: Hpt domain-containing protein [Lachnospiraceae bacterium]|nr:Hpt domain-containing protein [Lachnospiraceae bacterium]
MLTIEGLKDYGADVDEGLKRCVNNQAFYLKMVEKAAGDQTFGKLTAAIETGQLDEAFEAAHALKGVYGNLALTPLYQPVSELTELLRGRTQMDYTEYVTALKCQKEKLDQLI